MFGCASLTPSSLGRYIQRFRNPDKLQGESGYYLSSLVSAEFPRSVGEQVAYVPSASQNAAVSFIERLDHASLSNISQSEFEKYV